MYASKLVFFIFGAVVVGHLVQAAPADCVPNDAADAEEAVYDTISCLRQQHFAQKNTITSQQRSAMLAITDQHAEDFATSVRAMIAGANCSEAAIVPADLRDHVVVVAIENKYCMLFERNTAPERQSKFVGGWPVLVVRSGARLSLHHSVPHYASDARTVLTTTNRALLSESRSLLIGSLRRDAYNKEKSSCQSKYYPSDGAHDTSTMFHIAAAAVAEAAALTDVHMQWHGKGSSTCAADDALISEGVKYGYTAQSLATQLAAALIAELPADLQTISTPATSSCYLRGTGNPLGRLLNGVPAADVCSQGAIVSLNRFVHIEQSPSLRQHEVDEAYANALVTVFE